MEEIKILIVDDSNINLLLLETCLEEDFKVTSFIEPQKAVEYIKYNTPDLIISDLMMPDIDGFQLLEKTKEVKPDIPFIILSAYDEREYINKALKMGADDYLCKPIDINMLYNKINLAISTKQTKSYEYK